MATVRCLWSVCLSPDTTVAVIAPLLLFFFNDTATTEICTLSLHDALPISNGCGAPTRRRRGAGLRAVRRGQRSEEHTSELQSRFGISYAVFCLKKKKD